MRTISYSFILCLAFWGFLNPVHSQRHKKESAPEIVKNLNAADSAYVQQDFQTSSFFYQKAFDLSSNTFTASTYFKWAYALYRVQSYNTSIKYFSLIQSRYKNYLPEFTAYFKIKCLWHINPKYAVDISSSFIASNSKHALADSLILPLADYLYTNKQYAKARIYYKMFHDNRIQKDKYAYSEIQAALCLYYEKKLPVARDEFAQILRLYSSQPETFEFAKWLEKNDHNFYNRNFFKIVDTYYGNRQYPELRVLLENYIKGEKDDDLIEKARFNLIKIYFAEGKYKTALYGFKNMFNDLKNKALEPYLRIYFARIYLSLGQKQNAINAYVDYAEQYPRRRLSPEAVWKAAWIAEELQDLNQAVTLYRNVRRHWPGSYYAREAYFREGFTYYRLGNINEAERIFNDIRFKSLPDLDRNRAQYWASICSDILDDSVSARRLRIDLAHNLWDNYYTMKSYLMHKTEIDTSWSLIDDFKSQVNPLIYYASGISNLLSYFQDAFEVKEVLGEQYAFVALEDVKLVANSLEEWIALAEIYKKLNAYGKAYRTYDYIDKKFFRDISYNDKMFLLKERFPFYYDLSVEKYAHMYGVEPELVLALMKQESLFNSKAHSYANAYGLMQLVPGTAREMAGYVGTDFNNSNLLFDPEFNIRLGTRYLRILSKQFNDHKEYILAAYNAGAHRVKRWKRLPGSDQIDVFIENVEYSQTRDYVRKVMKNYWAYKLLGNNFIIEPESLLLGYVN